MSDGISMYGAVTIRSGDDVVVDGVTNHFVDHAMRGILSMVCCKTHASLPLPANGWKMYLGRDTTTSTTRDMANLVDPIYDGLGVPPTWQFVTIHDGTSTGQWKVVYRAMWRAGTVSGQIGEAALYLRMPTPTAFGWTAAASELAMASRLSVADTDFDPHVIDPTKTLTIDWVINLDFA